MEIGKRRDIEETAAVSAGEAGGIGGMGLEKCVEEGLVLMEEEVNNTTTGFSGSCVLCCSRMLGCVWR